MLPCVPSGAVAQRTGDVTTVTSRTDADIRTLRPLRAMLVCPRCGSDRLVTLTFTSAMGEELVDLPKRPVAKCVDCGHRLWPSEVTAQEEPQSS